MRVLTVNRRSGDLAEHVRTIPSGRGHSEVAEDVRDTPVP